MPFVDTGSLAVIERLPGWHGRYFHSPSMTFAHYDFTRGASIHEHFHPEEEVYEVIEGELEVTIDGVAQIARAGLVAIVPGNARHSVKALTDGRAIIVDSSAEARFRGRVNRDERHRPAGLPCRPCSPRCWLRSRSSSTTSSSSRCRIERRTMARRPARARVPGWCRW